MRRRWADRAVAAVVATMASAGLAACASGDGRDLPPAVEPLPPTTTAPDASSTSPVTLDTADT